MFLKFQHLKQRGRWRGREGRCRWIFLHGCLRDLTRDPLFRAILRLRNGFRIWTDFRVCHRVLRHGRFGTREPIHCDCVRPGTLQTAPESRCLDGNLQTIDGFTLIATTVWLIDVLAAQVTVDATVGFVAFLACLGLAAWVFGHWAGVAASASRQFRVLIVSVAVCTRWMDVPRFHPIVSEMSDVQQGKIHWKMFREDRMASLLNRYCDGEDKYFDGQAVFLDFTAEWCLSCKANEKAFIETEAVKNALEELNAVAIKADWTNYDENITKWLKCFQSAGVPYYAILPADPSRKAILMGETVTTEGIVSALRDASGS